ncbi:hypothetical protein HOF65_06455 [bacterium]|nr:hypothetical protein [bacterium]
MSFTSIFTSISESFNLTLELFVHFNNPPQIYLSKSIDLKLCIQLLFTLTTNVFHSILSK